ncbi:YlcG family protein, partial [Klebsiella pneumoniae]|uniref:YlcG family protein n=1 Tax=Klebsiella pneumoniae TaxID=573 RepID=UPI0039C6A311
ARYGQEYVDWLNGPHEMTNYRREDFIRIRDEYRSTETTGGRMSRDVIERIRYRWKKLRLCRHRGTVLVDYRILRNFVRIYQTLGETA